MCLMHADGDGDKHCGSTKFCSIVCLQLCVTEMAEQFDLMQAQTESSYCRGCTRLFVRAFLAASGVECAAWTYSYRHHEPPGSGSEGG